MESTERAGLRAADEEIVFTAWPKIYRLYRPVLITEKIDGTNAAIGITESGRVYAQSRKRLISPEDDNHGFATWVHDNQYDLREALGPGLHFGEWYGQGIGRKYGLQEKRFALFNVKRWHDTLLPDRVDTTPLLYEGLFRDDVVQNVIYELRRAGSHVSDPRWSGAPEGIVVYFTQANFSFKVTLENDGMSKGEVLALGVMPDQVPEIEPVS
jgi:hypothetical protein